MLGESVGSHTKVAIYSANLLQKVVINALPDTSFEWI